MKQTLLAVYIGQKILLTKKTKDQALESKDYKMSEQCLGAIVAYEDVLQIIGYNSDMIKVLLQEIIDGKHS